MSGRRTAEPAGRGVVAAGHPKTAEAAAAILDAGGNAFDAVLAGVLAACVVEPVLCSLGGGGFLLAAGPEREPVLFDFFAHTPRRRLPEAAVDFHPIVADFGTATQEFHVGLGAAAAPGTIPGLFHIHRRLASLPLTRIVEPALAYGRDGVVVNKLAAYLFDILTPIFTLSPGVVAAFPPAGGGTGVPREGERLRNPDLADLLDNLAREGEQLYRAGALGRAMVALSETAGGHLRADDIGRYRVIERRPLGLDYHGRHILTNPPPSAGGILIAFALQLLAAQGDPAGPFGSFPYLDRLARVMHQTDKARIESGMVDGGPIEAAVKLLDPGFVEAYADQVAGRPASLRGTTHISVLDRRGNAAALTISNGEGCGHVVPGTGFMLNNMLGEEDLHPYGFERWPEDTRIASMMAPSVLVGQGGGQGGDMTALGSGGSNRIRTALLQVLVNLIDHGMAPSDAVVAPRIHYERGVLHIEAGYPEAAVAELCAAYPTHELWPDLNLYFGGAHLAASGAEGAGDPRRGGVALVV